MKSTDKDLIDEIKLDHRELEQYYSKYKNASNMDEGKKWFNLYMWEICRHSVAEELLVYPLMENINEFGRKLADQSREDHRKVKAMLEDLRKEKDDTLFDKKFDDLVSEVSDHVKKEESEDLVFLQEKLSLEDRLKAGKSFSFRKKIVPTRPHPEIPDKPTMLEMGLGLLVTPIDKLRDMFTEFPKEVKS